MSDKTNDLLDSLAATFDLAAHLGETVEHYRRQTADTMPHIPRGSEHYAFIHRCERIMYEWAIGFKNAESMLSTETRKAIKDYLHQEMQHGASA